MEVVGFPMGGEAMLLVVVFADLACFVPDHRLPGEGEGHL